MSRRRWIQLAAIALVAAAALFLFLRKDKERPWELTLDADRRIAPPWTAFELTAQAHVADAREAVATDGWTWRWQLDGDTIAGTGPRNLWRPAREGKYMVSVTATSKSGQSKSAAIELTVRKPEVVDELAELTGQQRPEVDPAIHDVPFEFSEIVVEKNEVCIGEPSLIQAKASWKDGEPGNLVPAIAGMHGAAGAFMRFDGEPGMRRTTMTLRDPAAPDKFAEEEVYIELKDCYAPATLFVEATADRTLADRYAFIAKLMKLERGQPPKRISDAAATYRWDFGDGQTADSTSFEVEHTFPPEAERSTADHYTTYVVTVEAFDEAGTQLAKGYATVFLYNLRRQSKDTQGLVELVARFRDLPTTDEEGNKSIEVTLTNIDETETVQLTNIELRELQCDGKTETESEVGVTTIFDATSIGPKQSITGTFKVEQPQNRNACRVFATVNGTSSPGMFPAVGSFAMTVGDAFIKPITDQEKLEVIKQVTAILGTASFTDEDVRRLEDEGKIPRGVLRPPAQD